jgi:hypothetical protein
MVKAASGWALRGGPSIGEALAHGIVLTKTQAFCGPRHKRRPKLNLNDLLDKKGIDPKQVLAFRHWPRELELRHVLGWLAAEQPDVFNAYQQTQYEKQEKAMKKAAYLASFIGYKPHLALFVGLYSIRGSRPISREEFWQIPANIELKKWGMSDFPESSVLLFDLALTDFYALWKGKLVVHWPPPARVWWRWANSNEIPIHSILEDSALVRPMPQWDTITLSWRELCVLPASWRSALEQWRGVYYIFDTSDSKGYVGAAYGEANLLGRCLQYEATGHGGNRLLRKRDPANFRISILQRVSPDMDANDVIQLEGSWKDRLHTRAPFGLNEN